MHKANLVLPEVTSVTDSSAKGQKRRADDGDEEMVVEEGTTVGTESHEAALSPQRKKAEVAASSQTSKQPTITYEEIQKFSYPIKDIEGQSFILKVILLFSNGCDVWHYNFFIDLRLWREHFDERCSWGRRISLIGSCHLVHDWRRGDGQHGPRQSGWENAAPTPRLPGSETACSQH